jgi:hypothetical protein
MEKEADSAAEKEDTKKKGTTLYDRLEAAKKKVQQLQALKQKREAKEKYQQSKAERAADTRRKILLGAVVLGRVARSEWTKEQLDNLAQELTRDDDRALFGLPPIPAS